MKTDRIGSRLDWVSDEMFPFKSRFATTPRGHQMHYVDEGSGEPIVFVHGNPAWSFKELDCWRSELSDAEIHEFADCGHFLAEEAPDRILPLLHTFMK